MFKISHQDTGPIKSSRLIFDTLYTRVPIKISASTTHAVDIQVKWTTPLTGQHLGSIGEDGVFKLWSESNGPSPGTTSSTAQLSTASRPRRHFRLSGDPIPSKTLLPFSSLDFRVADAQTFAALVTRDGNLSVLEPRDHDAVGKGEWVDWMGARDYNVTQPIPSRGEETSFVVAWHQDVSPCWTLVDAGLDRRSMGLVVAAMDKAVVYRADPANRVLYVTVVLDGANDLVRGIAWANGSVRGHDVIATASKDGVARVYELRPARSGSKLESGTSPERGGADTHRSTTGNAVPGAATPRRNPLSGIGAGLAGISSAHDFAVAPDTSQITANTATDHNSRHIKSVATLVAELAGGGDEAHLSLWRVGFSRRGDLLTVTGDDGAVRVYKQAPGSRGDAKGEWTEYAEIDVKDWT